MEEHNTFTALTSKGFLEPALFSQERNVLDSEIRSLITEKTNLVTNSVSGVLRANEVKDLINYVPVDNFDGDYTEELFKESAMNIIVNSRDELTFSLKCDPSLKRKMVRQMACIPYGYKTQDEVITVDEKAAGQVRVSFEKYISGLSLTVTDEQTGIEKTHSVTGCILKNIDYLGNDTYSVIIDKEVFDKAEEAKDKCVKDLGRVVELVAFISPPPKERFKMKKAGNKMPVDPFERVEYLYSLIESEE